MFCRLFFLAGPGFLVELAFSCGKSWKGHVTAINKKSPAFFISAPYFSFSCPSTTVAGERRRKRARPFDMSCEGFSPDTVRSPAFVRLHKRHSRPRRPLALSCGLSRRTQKMEKNWRKKTIGMYSRSTFTREESTSFPAEVFVSPANALWTALR